MDNQNIKIKHKYKRQMNWLSSVSDMKSLEEHFADMAANGWMIDKYDGIIMDPPSYGRGPGGEVWKLEELLFSLIEMCSLILSKDAGFFILNSYTTGLSPAVMQYLLSAVLIPQFGGTVSSDEIGLNVTQTNAILPCGSTAIWSK